jgi:hypothetical protein
MITLHGGFISTKETLGSPLVGIGVGLENRRTSGENEVLLENLEADVQSRYRMCGPKYHSGRTAPSLDVRYRV